MFTFKTAIVIIPTIEKNGIVICFKCIVSHLVSAPLLQLSYFILSSTLLYSA